MWLLWLPESENDLKHSSQVNGFSPEWVFRWVLSSDDWGNDLEHSLQINGFSPKCVLRLVLRWADVENDLEHSLQINGLSPDCFLRCSLRLPESENLRKLRKWIGTFFTSRRLYGFSPEGVLRWVLSSCSNVVIKIAWIGKWFKTFFTSKWPLSRMGF